MTPDIPDFPTFPFGLLHPHDPPPVTRYGPQTSRHLVVCDHGGNIVPSGLDLGVGPADLGRHIGYDIGARGVAEQLAKRLEAEAIIQNYSRLVIDCNRPPSEPSAFPERVDGTEIPGNHGLSARDAASRTAEIFHPYHAAIGAALDTRVRAGVEPIILAVHSYTPQHGDFPGDRPWPVSLLFNRDPAFSLALSAVLRAGGMNVGENVPYQVGAIGDYTVPVHGERRGIAHTLIEVRQDLIGDAAEQRRYGDLLADAILAATADRERVLA